MRWFLRPPPLPCSSTRPVPILPRAEEVPDASILAELEANLRNLAPALMEEARLARAGASTSSVAVEQLAARRLRTEAAKSPIENTGSWEFKSERDPSQTYRVAYGRVGHLECTCKGFEFRGTVSMSERSEQQHGDGKPSVATGEITTGWKFADGSGGDWLGSTATTWLRTSIIRARRSASLSTGHLCGNADWRICSPATRRGADEVPWWD